MKFSIIIIFALMIISCNNEKLKIVHSISEETTTDTLFAKEKPIPVQILIPVKSVIINDKLVIYDRYKQDVFKVFKLPGLDFLYSQGKIGNGPDEFKFIDEQSINEYKNKLVLLDDNRYKELLIEDEKLRTVTSQVVETDVKGTNFALLNDSTYVSCNKSCEENYELMMVDLRKKRTIKLFGDYPEFSKQIKTCNDKYLCGNKIITTRPSDGRIAVFYLFTNIVKFYDRNGILLSETHIGEEKLIDHVPNGSEIIYRCAVYSNSKFIYALNIKAVEEDYFKNHSMYKPRFEIWSWDGQLLHTYVLNKAILSFAVSDKYNRMYSSTLDEASKIFEFELPPL